MFFYIILTPISIPLPVYEVPAIRVYTTKSTYTFTSVVGISPLKIYLLVYVLEPRTQLECCKSMPKFQILSDIIVKSNMFLKGYPLGISFGSKDCTKELKLECAYFLGQSSWFLPFRLHQ